MKYEIDNDKRLATTLRLALNESFPEPTFGAASVFGQQVVLEALLTFEDGGLAGAPQLLGAHKRR